MARLDRNSKNQSKKDNQINWLLVINTLLILGLYLKLFGIIK